MEIVNGKITKDLKRMLHSTLKTDVDIVLDDGSNIKVRVEVN